MGGFEIRMDPWEVSSSTVDKAWFGVSRLWQGEEDV